MTAPASYAKEVSLDVIAQLAAFNEVTPLVVPTYSAEFDRMYVSDLEDLAPAGGTTSQMQLVFAPIESKVERTGWGAVRVTISIGILFNVAVTTANGVVTDPNIDAYEQMVDQVVTWLMGPRTFADGWSASDPMPIMGDHYNDHLYSKSEFHVPVLVDFFADMGVS